MDVQFDVLEWSEESYRIFDVPQETPLACENYFDSIHPDDRDMVDQAWQAALGGAPYSVEHRIIVGDTLKWVHQHADLEFDGEGALRGAFGTTQDITEGKRAEEELKRALAAKDDFLSMVSHEMRTPLTAILGNASLLLGPALLGEERQSLLEDIREGAERLAGIINNMLALARVQAGRKMGLAKISLCAVVEQLASQHRMRYGQRRLQVRVEGEVPDVTAAKEYLSHILSNLLENAEKYTPHNEPIEIELRHEGNEVAVRVLDRGIGLTAEEAANIFEPFYRSKRIADISPGVGIGLAVSKRLVEAQGGRIWALSRDGGGSEFGFTVPVAP